MVVISKKIVKGKVYYYLEHSARANRKITKKVKYLGSQVPKDIEKIKSEFLSEIYKEKWLNLLDGIKKNYGQELKKTPKSAKEKETENFAIRFTYDSNRIEGSTLTLRETGLLLKEGVAPKDRPLKDIKEAESHRKVFYLMLEHTKDLSLQTMLHWHKELLKDTEPGVAGKIREHGVTISGSRFVPPGPVELYPLLKEFFGWYERNKSRLHPVELAALVHLKFVTIHPFGNGNGRISRLMMNFVLHRHGYPMLDIEYPNRKSYYNALERSQIKKQEYVFLQWLFRRYMKEFKKYL